MALIEGCADPSICPSCVDLHGKKQKFKGHTLLAAGVKDYGADALAKFGKAPNGVFCTIHPSQMRIMQCISPCGGKLLCPLCFAGHELHKLGRLPELAVAAKQLISNVLAATSYGPGAPVIVASDLSFSSSELSSPKTFDSAGVDASSVLQPAEVQKSAATGPPPFIAAARATCQSLLSHMEALPASESTALKFVGEMEASLLEAVQKRCAELRAEIAKVAALKKVALKAESASAESILANAIAAEADTTAALAVLPDVDVVVHSGVMVERIVAAQTSVAALHQVETAALRVVASTMPIISSIERLGSLQLAVPGPTASDVEVVGAALAASPDQAASPSRAAGSRSADEAEADGPTVTQLSALPKSRVLVCRLSFTAAARAWVGYDAKNWTSSMSHMAQVVVRMLPPAQGVSDPSKVPPPHQQIAAVLEPDADNHCVNVFVEVSALAIVGSTVIVEAVTVTGSAISSAVGLLPVHVSIAAPPTPLDDVAQAAAQGVAGVPSLIKTFTANSADAAVVAACCIALRAAAQAAPAKVTIAQAGAIPLVLTALTTHVASAPVASAACALLQSLAVNDDNEIAIAKQGGLALIVAALSKHTGSAAVCAAACGALRNLSSNAENKVTVSKAGAVQLLCLAASTHAGDTAVVAPACGALQNLASNADNRVTIARAGAIALFSAMLSTHPGDAGVVASVCGALRNLSGNAESKAAIARSGAIPHVCAALAMHSADGNVLIPACGVLRVLVAENKPAIVQGGAVSLLQVLLARHPAGSPVGKAVTDTLVALQATQ